MCRSIKTLRPPVLPEEATEDDIRAAALQYVRKVSGFRAPAAHNREIFEQAVDEIADATRRLLDGLEIRGSGGAGKPGGAGAGTAKRQASEQAPQSRPEPQPDAA